MFVHEDDRRHLIEIPGGVVVKAITAKDGCVLGNHYHRNKDESFLLVRGQARHVIIGEDQWECIAAPHFWHVPRGTFHVFTLEPGSVLIGTATAEFDPKDEIAGRPNG